MTTNNRITDLETTLADLSAKSAAYKAQQLEGGEGYNPHLGEIMQVSGELIALKADAEWTREVTIARRAAWNAGIKSIATPKGVPSAKLFALQQSLGFSPADLKLAVQRHGL